MSTAYKCDRCGEFYESHGCGEFYESHDRGEIKKSLYEVRKENRTADLCPDCRDDLHRWYENPKKDRPVGYWMGHVADAAREAWEAIKDTPEYKAAVEAAAERTGAEEGGEQE